MFTGIIEEIGKVISIEKRGAFGRITIGALVSGLNIGDSVACNGVCLTVTAFGSASFSADISSETLGLTTLGGLNTGHRVNLERALTLSKPIGGHLVTGHVDGVGVIREKASRGENVVLVVELPSGLMRQVVKKGSIAVDGISLTVADIQGPCFRVAIVPHTMKKTTLESTAVGSRVNIETDIIGKYVESLLAGKKDGVTADFLAEHGFLKRE